LFIDGTQKYRLGLLHLSPLEWALLSYMALREPNTEFSGKKNAFLKLLDSLDWCCTDNRCGHFGCLWLGEWRLGNFVQQWQTSRFIHVMSLDFCLLCLLFPALLGDDDASGFEKSQLFWLTALIPLLVPDLSLRPPLPAADAEKYPALQRQPQTRT